MSKLETFDDVLAHYGVKGMKWGRRKESTRQTSVSVQETPGKRLKTSGGHDNPAHDDAKRAAVSRQKAKSSSTDSLSTKELQELVTRMNLEQQYGKLSTAQPQNPAQKFVKDLLSNTAKQQITRIANDYAGKQVGSLLEKQGKKS